MLQPTKQKFRKSHRDRGFTRGKAQRCNSLTFGLYGLKAQTGGEVTSRQIEAARRAVTHEIKRGGKIWIRIFPHKPVTCKAAEVPMGAGKGMVEFYAAVVKPGTVLFEMEGISEASARLALKLAGSKLPVRTRFCTKNL
ncbi:50S ribosomal protein L16 [Candidatus Peregrinibacteria bacterium]|nr:50S ribosomal protein L16 [Candidatus Peregrinibacteria bacterium]